MNDYASKRKGLLWVLGALALGILLAAGISPLAHLIPMSWERRLGRSVEFDVMAKPCRADAQAEALLGRILARIYPLDAAEKAQPIELKVACDPVVNAFAGLGGKVTLNSGLLAKAESAEEVAGVLAHEIEHLRHRHVMEGMLVHLFSWQGLQLIFGSGGSAAGTLIRSLLNMDFTRGQESQADEEGLKRLQKAHVDTGAVARFFERMQKEQPNLHFLSDHPDSGERARMAESHVTVEPRPLMTAAEWKSLKKAYAGR